MAYLKTEVLGVAAKDEVTYATDPGVSFASDAVQPKDVQWTHDLSEADIQVMAARPRSAGKVATTAFIKNKFLFNLGGPADPGSDPLPVPSWMRFLLACGCALTSSGTPAVDTHTVVYDHRVAQKSLSILCDMYQEGAKNVRRHKWLGCRYSLTWSVEVGGLFELAFDGLGLWGGDEDVSAVTLPTYPDVEETDDAAAGRAMTITINGVAVEAKKLTFKSNRSTSMVKNLGATYGAQRAMIDAAPGSVFELELDRPLVMKADEDVFGDWLAGVRVPLVIAITTAGGTVFTMTAPRAQYGNFKYEKDEGIWRIPQTMYLCDATSGGDTAVEFEVTRV